jgi:hypothetical protein
MGGQGRFADSRGIPHTKASYPCCATFDKQLIGILSGFFPTLRGCVLSLNRFNDATTTGENTMEKQLTFGDIVGMDSAVATARLRNDWIECSDGTVRVHEDVLYDCRDNPHSNEDDQFDANVEIVTEILDNGNAWVCEYCESDDYGGDYAFCVDENYHKDYEHVVEEWCRNNLDNWSDDIVRDVCEKISSWDCDAEYQSSEYAAWSGSGCCVWSFSIGEYEQQTGINDIPEFKELHSLGDLDDILDEYNGDCCVHRSKRREKNEETGRYEDVGRETYDDGSDYPCLMTYHNPGGAWHFVISDDRMNELVSEAIVNLCSRADYRRKRLWIDIGKPSMLYNFDEWFKQVLAKTVD